MNTFDFPHPLRLAVGSHEAGSGKGCAMNVVSYENGDERITDLPDCADPMLAKVVQGVNDKICIHRHGDDLLCPECSVEVLALAHRTVGTRLDHLTEDERRRVWVRLALDEAESVAHPDESPEVTQCRRVTQQWLDGAATEADVRKVSDAAADAAAYSAAYAAAAYASYATYADADATATTASAANAAAAYASAGGDRLARAHALISRFEALTGVRATEPQHEVVTDAVARMHASA